MVFDVRVRSFPPIEPLVLAWQYPLWQRDLTLDPSALKTGRKSRDANKAEQPVPPKPEPWTVHRFVAEFLRDTPQPQKLIAARARQAGVRDREFGDLLELALADGHIHRAARPTRSAWRPVRQP